MPFQRGKACVLPAPGPVGANRCLQASLTPSDKIFAFSDKETPPQGDIQSWYSPIQIPWLSLVLLKIINKPESSPSSHVISRAFSLLNLRSSLLLKWSHLLCFSCWITSLKHNEREALSSCDNSSLLHGLAVNWRTKRCKSTAENKHLFKINLNFCCFKGHLKLHSDGPETHDILGI